MYVNNPYAQGGWHNPQNPYSINNGVWRSNSRHPPTYGALPPADQDPPSVLDFHFASFNPDIYQCKVTGPDGRKFFEISTPAPHMTIISKPGKIFAQIHWQSRAILEAVGIISRQFAGDFLKLSADQRHRIMNVNGRAYAWIPRKHEFYLYSTGPNPATHLAKISPVPDKNEILLRIATEAFQEGLFEPCIMVTVLLFSGKNID
ncbi:hypothetical protein B0H34DRAFT_650617 [Crassisporium funariophilum]|nr:hypothetical protein B0H34DRAFT_650617 [Crassisporium funariophilum]